MNAEAWIDVGSATELQQRGRLHGEIDGTYVLVVEHEGELHAIEDRCSHDGEGFADAPLEGDPTTPCGVVICPRHGARFCLATGAALTPPAYEAIRVFAVRRHDDRIEVRHP